MAKFRVEGKVQVAVMVTVEARNEKDAVRIAGKQWVGLNDGHGGKSVGVFDDDDTDPGVCEDGSEPEWISAEKLEG